MYLDETFGVVEIVDVYVNKGHFPYKSPGLVPTIIFRISYMKHSYLDNSSKVLFFKFALLLLI